MKVSKFSIIVAFVLACTLLLASGCSSSPHKKERNNILIVNGQEIQNFNIVFYKNGLRQYAAIPLLALLHELGYSIEWSTPYKACITVKKMSYTLDIQKHTLVSAENLNDNLLLPPPGGHYYCESTESDVILDTTTLKNICMLLEIPITISIDYKRQTINISTNM